MSFHDFIAGLRENSSESNYSCLVRVHAETMWSICWEMAYRTSDYQELRLFGLVKWEDNRTECASEAKYQTCAVSIKWHLNVICRTKRNGEKIHNRLSEQNLNCVFFFCFSIIIIFIIHISQWAAGQSLEIPRSSDISICKKNGEKSRS